MSALLELSGVSVAIGKARLLEGIDLRLDRGQILGLVGESGSGKSLTAMAAMGLLPLIGGRVTAGEVRFDGTDLATLGDVGRRRLRGRRIVGCWWQGGRHAAILTPETGPFGDGWFPGTLALVGWAPHTVVRRAAPAAIPRNKQNAGGK